MMIRSSKKKKKKKNSIQFNSNTDIKKKTIKRSFISFIFVKVSVRFEY